MSFIGLLVFLVFPCRADYTQRVLGSSTMGWNWYGPKTVVAGRDTWYNFQPRWVFTVTANPATSVWDTGGSYTPTGSEPTVQIFSTGTLPTGVYFQYGWERPQYAICDVSGNTFKLRQNTCSGSVVTFTGSGTGTLYAVFPNDFYNGTNRCVYSTSGFPANTTVEWWQGDGLLVVNLKGTAPQCDLGHVPIARINVPAGTTPGIYTVTINFSTSSGNANPFALTFDIDVIALSPLATSAEPSSYPAISGLSTWSTWLNSGTYGNYASAGGAPTWCNKATGQTYPDPLAISGGNEGSGAWYYDGSKLYRELAAYSGDADWLRCANSIAGAYVNNGANGVPAISEMRNNVNYGVAGFSGQSPWPMFAEGVARSSRDLYDSRLRMAVEYMTRSFTEYYGYPIVLPAQNNLRPMAVKLAAYMDRHQILGAPLNSFAHQYAALITQNLDSLADGTGRPGGDNTFMVGMAMRALEKYYETTPDPNIPRVIKRTLDWLTTDAYDATSKSWTYNTAAEGPTCSCPNVGTCATGTSWFVTDPTGTCNMAGDSRRYGYGSLNNMINHAAAWYWRKSGTDSYKTQADDSFAHVFDNVSEISTGKAFVQIFVDSFYFIRLRSGR